MAKKKHGGRIVNYELGWPWESINSMMQNIIKGSTRPSISACFKYVVIEGLVDSFIMFCIIEYQSKSVL